MPGLGNLAGLEQLATIPGDVGMGERLLLADSVEKLFGAILERNSEGLRTINRATIVDCGPI